MKPIFIDIDGTLINSKQQLTPRTVTAIKKAKEAGYEPIICTGRSVSRVKGKGLYQAIDSKYLIYAGCGIFDCVNQKVLYENVMDKDALSELYEVANIDDSVMVFLASDIRYANKPSKLLDPNSAFFCDTDIVIKEPIDEFLKSHNVIMVLVLSENYETLKKISAEAVKIPGFRIGNQSKALSDPSFPLEEFAFIDVIKADGTKGFGVKNFCDMFGVDVKDAICIGDDLNDLEMFQTCGYGVAMGNALPIIKKHATYVTDTNDNEGVAKFLEKLPGVTPGPIRK